MPNENLARVLADVRSLTAGETAAERAELLARLRNWPTLSSSAEDDVDQRLLSAGVIDLIPPPPATAGSRPWTPIAAKGKPVSETIVEERR